ncbi:MAG TPA: hypothetical protein VNU68_03040 [Verrucomicrobiae bacterium]|nr:hypothetical protein [Verrucomicrobiae bacterium]
MKLEFHSKWVHLRVEFFPRLAAIRRYRVMSQALDTFTQRSLRRRISRRLRHSAQEAA